MICYIFFFFFKQKTAYEMRISDWSSDVCSSDLGCADGLHLLARREERTGGADHPLIPRQPGGDGDPAFADLSQRHGAALHLVVLVHNHDKGARRIALHRGFRKQRLVRRSEEHTSELQSLLRNSYAVFCLKKK